MKKLINRSIISIFCFILCMQGGIYAVEARERTIVEYHNRLGPYYNQDLTTTTNQMTQIDTLQEGVRLPNFIQFNQEQGTSDNRILDEVIDEKTVVFQSVDDPNLKQLDISFEDRYYATEQGYKKIDTSIETGFLQRSGEGYAFKNEKNTLKSYYSSNIDEQGVSINKDNVSLFLTPTFTSVGEPVLEGSQIIYPMENDVNIHYQVFPGKVKEDIVLNTPNSKISYVYQIRVDGGEVVYQNNSILVNDSEGNISFIVNAPYVEDAAGNRGSVEIRLEGNQLSYHIEEEWFNSADRVFPVRIDPIYSGYAHNGIDTSVSYNYPNHTFSSPNLEAAGWVLRDPDDAYIYLGKDPKLGDSYSFYKLQDEQIKNTLKGKYIKSATYFTFKKEASINSNIVVCSINSGANIQNITYLGIPQDITCSSSTKINSGSNIERVDFDVTAYIKGVVEEGKNNNGVMLVNQQGAEGYIRLFAHEYYYLDPSSHTLPGITVEYYDQPDITDQTELDSFTAQIRPFVKSNKTEGLVHFVAWGADGIAPLNSEVTMTIKSKDTENQISKVEAKSNFYIYPNYPVVEQAQVYEHQESNYQFTQLYDDFEINKIYDIDFIAEKDGEKSEVKRTWFQLYQSQSFMTINKIATFYGVSIDTLMKDNNMMDGLVTEGNLLFIREPTRNKGVPFVPEDLSEDEKKQIDAMLQGRGVQCEFGFEPINLNTGNFLLESTDTSFKVGTNENSFVRTYNSIGTNTFGSIGYGWRHSEEIDITPGEKGVTLSLGDGKRFFFTLQEDGTYSANNNTQYSIKESNGIFEISDYTTVMVFNRDGSIQKKIHHNGKETIYEYEGALLKAVNYPEGQSLQFAYSSEGLLTSITTPNGKNVSYEYNGIDLVKMIDPSGATVTYEYDEKHRMTSWINRNQEVVIENEYDDFHRVIKQTDQEGTIVYLEYQENLTITTDGNGNVEKIYTDNFGQTTAIESSDGSIIGKEFEQGKLTFETLDNNVSFQYTYDDKNNIIKVERSDGFIQTKEYDSRNNLIKVSNNEGQKLLYSYDTSNNLLSKTNELGKVTTYQYNDKQQLVKETDANGNSTNYEYNSGGNISKIIYPDETTFQYFYNDAGYLVRTIDEQGNEEVHLLSDRNELIAISYADGTQDKFEWDSQGNLTAKQSRIGGVTRYEYNVYGQVTKEVDPLGNSTVTNYDGNQNIKEIIYADGTVRQYEYDVKDQVIKMIYQNLETTYTYNEFGVVKTTNPQGNEEIITYDDLGRVIQVKNFDGTIETKKYDRLGQITEEVDRFGNKTTTIYLADGNVSSREDENSKIVNTYDHVGNLVEQTITTDDSQKTFRWVYNQSNKLIEEVDAMGYSTVYELSGNQVIKEINALQEEIHFKYDKNGHLIEKKYENDVVETWSYDALGNMITSTDGNGHSVQYRYDFNNNITQMIDARGYLTTYSYDSMNRIIKETGPIGQEKELTYNQHGNLSEIKRNGVIETVYEYDEYHQIVKETHLGVETSYVYNSNGLITKEIDGYGLETAYEYDEYNQLIKEVVQGTPYDIYTYDDYQRQTSHTNRYGAKLKTEYNANFQKVKEIDFNGVETTYGYDLNERLIEERDSLGNITQYQYDKLGRLLSTSVNGNVSYYEYDVQGNVVTEIDPLNNVLRFSYDAAGNKIKEVNAEGNETEWNYNENNQVIQEKVQGNVVQELFYDARGNVVKVADGLNQITQYVYNKNDQVIEVITPRGYKRVKVYDNRYNLIKEIDELGNSKIYTYNNQNQVIEVKDERGYRTSMDRDIYGNVEKIIYPNQSSESYVYNELNQLVQVIKQSGLKQEFEYNNQNMLLKQVENGLTTKVHEYDDFGRLVSVQDALGSSSRVEYNSLNQIVKEIDDLGNNIQYTYDSLGRIETIKNEQGTITENKYDSLGRIIEEKTEDRVYRTEYDDFGNVKKIILPDGQTLEYEYDLANQLIKEIDGENNEIQYVYDQDGNLIQEIDALGNTVEMVVDAVGRVIQIKDPEGGKSTTHYDAQGNIKEVQNALGFWVRYEYDSMGQMTKEISQSQETSYQYNAQGQVTKIKDPLGEIEHREYDDFGNLIKKITKNKEVIPYEYDGNHQVVQQGNISYQYDTLGNLIEVVDEQGEISFSYDELGQLIETNQYGSITQYEYNQHGEQILITYSDGSEVAKEYNNSGNLIRVESDSIITEYLYNQNNQVIEERNSANITTTMAYNELGLLVEKKLVQGGIDIQSTTFEYNKNQSVVKEVFSQYGDVTVRENQYNLNDELIETKQTINGEVKTLRFFYSLEGNKVETRDRRVTSKEEYNDKNQLVKTSDENYGYQFIYDANGNRIQEKRSDGRDKLYEYDEYNQLIFVRDFNGTEIRYAYDGLGNRVTQEVSRMKTVYEVTEVHSENKMDILIQRLKLQESESFGNLCLVAYYNQEEIDELPVIKTEDPVYTVNRRTKTEVETNVVETIRYNKQITVLKYQLDYTAEYVNVISQNQDGKVTSFIYGHNRLGTQERLFITDGFNHVTMVQSSHGSLQERYTYSTYGQRDIDYDPFIGNNEYGYRSEAHTADNHQYLRARIYDAKSTIFIQEDTHLGDKEDTTSRNRYTYGRNNPYKYDDPSGHIPRKLGGRIPKPTFPLRKPSAKKAPPKKVYTPLKKKPKPAKKVSSVYVPPKVFKQYTPPKTAVYLAQPAKAKTRVTTKVVSSFSNSMKTKMNATKKLVAAQMSQAKRKVLGQKISTAKVTALNNFSSGLAKKYPPVLGRLHDRLEGVCEIPGYEGSGRSEKGDEDGNYGGFLLDNNKDPNLGSHGFSLVGAGTYKEDLNLGVHTGIFNVNADTKFSFFKVNKEKNEKEYLLLKGGIAVSFADLNISSGDKDSFIRAESDNKYLSAKVGAAISITDSKFSTEVSLQASAYESVNTVILDLFFLDLELGVNGYMGGVGGSLKAECEFGGKCGGELNLVGVVGGGIKLYVTPKEFNLFGPSKSSDHLPSPGPAPDGDSDLRKGKG